MDDIDTARSRTGYIILYAACAIIWAAKLQTEIALSTTEAEYIALSTALREVIPLIDLLQELLRRTSLEPLTQPTVHCKVFEDNSGALELATVPKMRPRTKHINVKYHHFREHVRRKPIRIQKIDSENQLGDLFTKPCATHLFVKFRKAIMGWEVPIRRQVYADEGVRHSETGFDIGQFLKYDRSTSYRFHWLGHFE